MKIKIFIFILLLTGISYSSSYGESVHSKITKGTNFFNEKKFDKALENFTSALIDDPDNDKLKYNTANSYYNLQNYEEAARAYTDIIVNSTDEKLKKQANYNLGNTFFRQGKLQEAIDQYKKTLELNPDDLDSKYNLEFTQKEILKREEQQKQQQEGEEGDKKEDEKKDQQQSESKDGDKKEKGDKSEQKEQDGEKENKDMKTGEEGKQEDEKEKAAKEAAKEDEEDKKDEGTEQQNAMEPSENITEEEAVRWLESLEEDRTKFMKRKFKRQPGRGSAKDW